MDSPPFQVPIPPAVAKLVGNDSKLQGLNSRLLDSDGINPGTIVTTGFGASPTFKTQSTGFMNQSGSNSNQNLVSSNYNTVSSTSDRENGTTPTHMDVVEDQNVSLHTTSHNNDSLLVGDSKTTNVTLFLDDSKSKLSIAETPRGNVAAIVGDDAKLSGTKRPYPDEEERSVITIQEDSSSRERKPRDSTNCKKSPRQVKPSGLQHFVDDSDLLQGSSNQGENNSRGAPLVPASNQPRITNFFVHQPDNVSTNNNNNNSTASTSSASSSAAISSGSSGKARTSSRDSGAHNPPANVTAVNINASNTNTSNTNSSMTSRKEKQPSSTAIVSDNTNSSMGNNNNSNNINDMRRQLETMRVAKEQAEIKVSGLEAALKSFTERSKTYEERNLKLMKSLEEIHRKMAMQEFRRKRDQLALDCVRLGKITTVRTGPTTVGDVWEEGYAIKELNKRTAELLSRKEELEARKKKMANMKRAITRKAAKIGDNNTSNTNNNNGYDGENSTSYFDPDIDVDMDLTAESEVIKSHFEQLKKDEIALAEERRLLESEKAAHQKEIKRCQCEERSRFYRDLPTLHDRYLLQTMLGRGGFSEVWKALDLQELKEVAVKIHQLNPQWSEERKSSYIKHVTREYTIHRDMKHPRVVQLFDVFEIDLNSFATVLEYCRGIDLDEKLKRFKCIPEKDAKSIFLQMVSGLRYLHHPYSYNINGLYVPDDNNSNNTDSNNNSIAGNSGASNVSASALNANTNTNNNTVMSTTNSTIITSASNNNISNMNHMTNNNNNNNNNNATVVNPHLKKISIIHFDLKPANILFDEFGDLKITDFGLSKVIDEAHEGTSMELTSQGAGTYWYLPPECFEKGPNPPRISSKVDVWSVGIIFYQMLYGCRPFGEGKTQENVWTENIIYHASSVEFPSDAKAPKVSEEAKDLIRACLTRDQRLRPDVIGVCQHPYLKSK